MKEKKLDPRQEQLLKAGPMDHSQLISLTPHIVETMAKTLQPIAREAYNDTAIRQEFDTYLKGKERDG